MTEWEKNPGTDGLFEAFMQTGKEKSTEEWMEEGKRILEEGTRVIERSKETQETKEEGNETDVKKQGFDFLGKKGREGKEFTLRAVHSYRCKWDARTMHLPPIDMNVPEDQKSRAMRT